MDQQQKLIQLKADIELKEREYRKILTEIESLQHDKGIALKQFDDQIKGRKKEIEQLLEEGKRLQRLIKLYTDSYLELEKELAEIKLKKELDIKQAHEDVLMIYDDAENREKAVKDREDNVEMLKTNVDNRAIEVENKAIENQKRAIELDAEAKKNLTALEAIRSEEEKTKKALAEARELLDDMNGQIKAKTMQIEKLDSAISQKTKAAEKIGVEAQIKFANAEKFAAMLDRREAGLNEKDKELIIEKRRIRDQKLTIRRAYSETLQRGGNVGKPN